MIWSRMCSRRSTKCEAMYEETTDGVRVRATPAYQPAESAPADGRYFWAYTIEILNLSARTVRLMNRYWRIVDANGGVHEVRGDGVVGKQPVLKPGEAFTYTSGCPLTAPSGMMGGHYGMVDVGNHMPFTVTVPTFALDSPQASKRAN
jgi:ApaG protein